MKRENLLKMVIAHFIVVVVALFSLNACFIIAYYPEDAAYPTTEAEAYYVDLDYAPVYGVAIYYRLGPSYPYYYYHGGYGYYSYGRYYYRYYRVWTWGSVPYYWNNGGYVQIYEANYYSYNVTVNQWNYSPIPENYSYGAPADPPHYEGYPPDRIESGAPKSPSGLKITGLAPGATRSFAPQTKPEANTPIHQPKIPGISSGVMPNKPIQPIPNIPKSAPKFSGVSPSAMSPKPFKPIPNTPNVVPKFSAPKPYIPKMPAMQAPKSYAPKSASPKTSQGGPAYIPKSPAAYHKPSTMNFKPSYSPKTSVKPYHPPAKMAPSKSFTPKYHPPVKKIKH